MDGGVATKRGDLRCTMTLERWREVKAEPVMVEGEKAAIVGGWESDWPSCIGVEGAMESIHGRSSVEIKLVGQYIYKQQVLHVIGDSRQQPWGEIDIPRAAIQLWRLHGVECVSSLGCGRS